MSHPLFDCHAKTLESARAACRARSYWSAYPEVPSGKIYGSTARDDGAAAFKARLEKPFELDQAGTVGRVGDETSPYGFRLGITYPQADLDAILPAAGAAIPAWRDAGVEARTGVCLEILDRLNKKSFEMAHAVMHTTGQGFMMSFQAGGPHAQDRGLEAVAYAYDEMTRTPADVTWKKQVGKAEFVTLHKRYHVVPRGIAAVIGCSTFPTWNGYPGLFASLVTGNAVVVKPHPNAVLPLAMTVEVAQAVLKEQGFDPNLMTLIADSREAPVTRSLAARPEVRIIDYTGGSPFGDWIEQNAPQALVFTEKAGVNAMILDSVAELKPVVANLAFTLSLYSGQMCTTPQNIYIPADGIRVGDERVSFDAVARAIVEAIDGLLGDPRRAVEVLGAIHNEETAGRIAQAEADGGEVLRRSEVLRHEMFPEARVRSPLLLKVTADRRDLYMREMFGPVTYLIAVKDTAESIRLAAETARSHGAITWGLYSTDAAVLKAAEAAAVEAGVPLSCNLVGQIYVNQSAAFSDYHVTGANPSGNACLCDAAFVAGRFRVVQCRVPVEIEAAATR
ncbi:MAG: phenylacetic acid degradation protein PaaN [Phycisphaerae bacterium]